MPVSERILFALVCSVGVASAEVDFRQQIQPVLENACVRCHGADSAKGGLRLDTKAGFLKGGKHGPALDRIVGHLSGELTPKMPLGADLPISVIAEIKSEIAKIPVQPKTPHRNMNTLLLDKVMPMRFALSGRNESSV